MKLSRLFIAVAPVLLLQACASTPPPAPPSAVLSITGKTCTSEPSLKDAISLTPVKAKAYYAVSTLVDAGKPCLVAGDASSNYVVYALPAHGENHTVTVGGVEEAIRTFAPSVSLLDADGKVTRAFADDRFATYGNILGVQFVPQPQERYILVSSNPALVGKAVNTFETRIATSYGYTPATAYSYGGSYSTQHGMEGAHNRVFSHEGYVSVTIQAATGKVGLPDAK